MKKTRLYKKMRDVYFEIIHLFQTISVRKKYRIIMEENDYILNDENDALPLFYLPYYDKDLIQRHICNKRGYYEEDYLRFVTEKFLDGKIGKDIQNHIALDIGSNIGNHSLFFLKESGISHIHIFEPITDTFSIMKKNIELNGFSDLATLYNAGVSSNCGRANINGYSISNTGGAFLKQDDNGNIPLISIDSLNLSDVKLVKIDTEGFELEVIKGMKELVINNHPYIMIEINEKNRDEVLGEICSLADYSYYQYDEENYIFY